MSNPKITQEFFVAPNCDIQMEDSDYVTLARLSREDLRSRWEKSQGQYILAAWRANRFDRKTLDGLVGKFYSHTDLRGAPLMKADLESVDLSNTDLFCANLEDANLKYADLTESYLSEANLKGTQLDWAKTKNLLVDNASFDTRTSFTGVRLDTINFTLAEQLKDFAFGQQRIASLKSKHPQLSFVLWLTCNYGRSFSRFLLWCGGVILAFALAYTLIPNALNQRGFWSALYFSIMTFTTSGSDVQAVSATGKVLAALQSTTGFLMTGLLVAILIKRTIGD